VQTGPERGCTFFKSHLENAVALMFWSEYFTLEEKNMHKIDINPVLLARGREWRGGRERAFDLVDVSRVAHLVIDMQAGFVKEGAVAEVPQARTIVDNINAISRAVRIGGGLNVFLRFTYDPAEAMSWSTWYRTFLHSELAKTITAAFTAGRPEHELWEQIETAPEDLIINKTRFSAFTPGTCSLDAILKDRGIDTVIVTGTLTNCCSEATARDAHQLNYKVIFVADGNATITDEEHQATLGSLYVAFSDVMPAKSVLNLVESAAQRQVAAQ
jgi:ureidoacrylate peracid hydrolase